MAKPNENSSILIDRIRERLAAVGMSAAQASNVAFGNDGTIRNILDGKSRNPRTDTMQKLAQVLETTVEYLGGGEENVGPAPVRRKALPKREDPNKPTRVFASVEGGDGAMVVDNDPIEWTGQPNVDSKAQDDDLYGVVVEGVSMSRAYRPGDTVWLHPKFRERRDEACVFRGFNNVTGEALATIKWLVDFNSERWVVEQLNPEKRFELSRTQWPDCYRVLGKKTRP